MTKKKARFWKNIHLGGMAKDILMTFFGTTLSIVLTFGTAHFVESRQQRVEGRQAAMMVIHDIDESVRMLREVARKEDENLQLALYAIDHIDSLASLSEDSLDTLLEYILYNESTPFGCDDSKERTFLSSQENWKNIDTPLFVDLVEAFFYKRRVFMEQMNSNSPQWRSPVSANEFYEQMKNESYANNEMDYVAYLRGKLQDPRIRFYIQLSPQRQMEINEMATQWQNTSDRCKFLMGITDQELAEFIKKRERTGHPLTERELVGKWMASDTDERFETIEFMKDNTFCYTLKRHYSSSFFTGKLSLIQVANGTWELHGDSLYRTYAPDFVYTLDKSKISYSSQMKDSVESYLHNLEVSLTTHAEAIKKRPEVRTARFVSIDASGTKIELAANGDEQEDEQKGAAYLVRMKEE